MLWITLGSVAATLLVGAVAAFLGIPAWRLQRNRVEELEEQKRREKASREQAELAVAVARYLGVPVPANHEAGAHIPPPSEDHPTLTDVLKQIRDSSMDAARDASQTAVALAYHMADGHGPEPHRIRRWATIRAEVDEDP